MVAGQASRMIGSNITDAQLMALVMDCATDAEAAKERPSGTVNSGYFGSRWHFIKTRQGNYWRHATGLIIRSSKNW